MSSHFKNMSLEHHSHPLPGRSQPSPIEFDPLEDSGERGPDNSGDTRFESSQWLYPDPPHHNIPFLEQVWSNSVVYCGGESGLQSSDGSEVSDWLPNNSELHLPHSDWDSGKPSGLTEIGQN